LAAPVPYNPAPAAPRRRDARGSMQVPDRGVGRRRLDRNWLAFGLLGLIWGSSFLWIKIGVADISAALLIALRFVFGLAGLAAYAAWRRPPGLRQAAASWRKYLFMGIVNTALPI